MFNKQAKERVEDLIKFMTNLALDGTSNKNFNYKNWQYIRMVHEYSTVVLEKKLIKKYKF